jgi:hypothetical protein
LGKKALSKKDFSDEDETKKKSDFYKRENHIYNGGKLKEVAQSNGSSCFEDDDTWERLFRWPMVT